MAKLEATSDNDFLLRNSPQVGLDILLHNDAIGTFYLRE